MRLGFRNRQAGSHLNTDQGEDRHTGRNGLGVALSLFLLVGGGIALFMTLQTRPVNLRALSLEAADLLSQLLDKTGIPPESVHQTDPVLTQDGSAVWNVVSFEVNVPETINPEGLASLVARTMEQHGLEMKPLPMEEVPAGVSEPQANAGTPPEATNASGTEREPATVSNIPLRFVLLFEHHEFMRVVLHETFVRDDLTKACGPIADAVQTFLETQGYAKDRIQREEPKKFENSQAIWTLTRFVVPPLEGRSVDQLVPLLQQATASLDTEIAARTGINGTVKLAGSYRGAACVEVLFVEKALDSLPTAEASTETAALPAVETPVASAPVIAAEGSDVSKEPSSVKPELVTKEGVPPFEPEAKTDQKTEPEPAKPIDEVTAPEAAPEKSLAEMDPKLASLMSDLDKIPLDSSELSEHELGPAEEPTAEKTVGMPRVAIIVDDGGYGGAITSSILTMDSGLTLSIIPDTRHGVETARRAMELGFGVMLHLPMEEAKIHGELKAKMTAVEMEKALRDALVQVPGAVGINNHMGSAFTKNEKAMECFLTSMKKVNGKLYFIDSRTTAESKAAAAASIAGVRMASRDVFLDHQNTPAFMKSQFARLVALAKKRGHAIAICHFRATTAPLLAEMLPMLKEEGIQLVHASELVP